MAVAIAIWSLDLVPGQEEVVMTEADVHISNVSLGEKLVDQNSRTVVKVSYSKPADESDGEEDAEDEPSVASFILCSLTAGKAENAQVNLILEAETTYKFELVGKNPVSLSGNYIDQVNSDQPPFEGSEFESDEEEEGAYDLRDVSSDVEMNPDELGSIDSDASRFEEVEEGAHEKAKRGKRARDDDDKEPRAKADKNKKLKKESGEAVPVGKGDAESAEKERSDKKEKEDNKGKEDKEDKEDKKDKEGKKDKKEKKEKSAKVDQEVKEFPGGLKYQDATTGTGPRAKKGDKLQMRYIGKLDNGKVFDKNTKGKPFSFELGTGEVIKGWDQGLVGMQVGGERILTCPPNFAYGKKGSKPSIPGNTTLIFEVKLLAIN